MARYLVTGGCGFIGAKLVAVLRASGHEVRVIDDLSTGRREALPADVSLRVAPVHDATVLREAFADIDGCFHLAGDPSVPRCLEDYLRSHLANQTGTVACLDASRREADRRGRPVPVVYASSCAVYGLSDVMPLAEDTPAQPVSGYGVDKLAGEHHARIAADLLRVPSIGLRYFNVYGPGQSPDSPYAGVLSIFCRRLSADEPVVIHGDGMQVRDFVFVDDVVAATIVAMDRAADVGKTAPVINVCTGRPTTVLEAGRTIAGLCDRDFQPSYEAARAGDVTVSLGDPARLRDLLGISADTSIRSGLARTLEWMGVQPRASA